MSKRAIKVAVAAFAAIALITFCIVNRDVVAVSLFPLPYIADMPVFLLALLSCALGVFMAGVMLSFAQARAKHSLKQANKKIAALENEISALRTERVAPPALSGQ